MPKVLYTAIVADMRGSLSGSTFSRNGGGAFLRSRTAPVGQRSSFQQQRSATFISITTSWRSLTETERSDWNDFAKDVTSTDVFGYNNRKSGFQLFCELNGNLSVIGAALLTSPVTFQKPPIRTVSNVRWPVGLTTNVLFTVGGVGVSMGWLLAFYGSGALPVGRSDASAGLRYFNSISPAPGTTNNITGFAANFGIPALGERRNIKVDMINPSTGQKIPMYRDTLNIT